MTQSEQANTIPLSDAPWHIGEDVAPSLNLRDLQESWYQATPVFAASAEEASVTFAFWYLEQLIRQLWNDRVQLGTRLLIEPFSHSLMTIR